MSWESSDVSTRNFKYFEFHLTLKCHSREIVQENMKLFSLALINALSCIESRKDPTTITPTTTATTTDRDTQTAILLV